MPTAREKTYPFEPVGAGATGTSSTSSRLLSRFQSSPARGGGCNGVLAGR